MSADAPERSREEPAANSGAGFPRAARLLKHFDFERVYKQGKRHFSSHMTVFYLRPATGASPEGASEELSLIHIYGDLAEAVRQYTHASALQHADTQYLLLAQALRQEGRLDEANVAFQRAARVSPNLAQAQKTAESLLAGK